MKVLLLAALPLTTLAWPAPPYAPAPVRPTAPFDELRRERLPADVDFVLHFDLEGFQRTQLWKELREGEEAKELDLELDELQEFQERFGIDPFTDVRAVTLYKVQKEEDPTVVLFSASAKVDQALEKFKAEPGYQRVVEGAIELHTWKDEGDESAFAYVHRRSDTERVVVLASNKESALRGARVLRGEEPSHASAGTLLPLTPAAGSFLYVAAAHIPHLEEFTPASPVFGLAQGIQMDLGEAGGFLRGHLGVTTGSADDAFNVSNVVNGALSLARLTGSRMGELMELMNGLRLGTHGTEVTLDFEYGVSRLLEILRGLESLGDDDDSGDGF